MRLLLERDIEVSVPFRDQALVRRPPAGPRTRACDLAQKPLRRTRFLLLFCALEENEPDRLIPYSKRTRYLMLEPHFRERGSQRWLRIQKSVQPARELLPLMDERTDRV